MEHGKELFNQTISIILFCMAITILLRQATEYSRLVTLLKDTYQDSNAIYQSPYTISDNVSYAELVSSLFSSLEYDFEINGQLISKYEHTADQIDDYHIPITNYLKTYAYDNNGQVTRIIYTSIVGG